MENLIAMLYEEIESLKARVEALEGNTQTKKKSTRKVSTKVTENRKTAQSLLSEFTHRYNINYIFIGADVTNIAARLKDYNIDDLRAYMEWAWEYLGEDDFNRKNRTIGYPFQAKHFGKLYSLYEAHKEALRIKAMAQQNNSRMY